MWIYRGYKLGLCAEGGSGGSMQIAYGLSVYGLKDTLKAAVLTGGPPTADILHICDNVVSEAGHTITNYVMGWTNNGNYCKQDLNRPVEITERMERESLVVSARYPDEVRDYDYPKTPLVFVEGALDKNNIYRGLNYFNAVTTKKKMYILNEVPHGVIGTSLGAEKIELALRKRCK